MKNKIVQEGINDAKKGIKSEIRKDHLIMMFTRIIEDIKIHKDPDIQGRLKELYLLICPYDELENTRDIYNKFMNLNLSSKWGLKLTSREENYIDILRNNLTEECRLKNPNVMKGRLNGILKKLIKEYLSGTSELLNAYDIGKLISSMGGLRNLSFKPAGTIQLIGAEKALFRHKRNTASSSPKYGILFQTKEIQQFKNKGKATRVLSNKLAIALRQDYFNLIKNEK